MSIYDDIQEIAEARAPRKGIDVQATVERATHYIDTGKVTTAPKAVEWAFHDLWDAEQGKPVEP